MSVLAIDPGNVESAYVLIAGDRRPIEFGKLPNAELLAGLRYGPLGSRADHHAIEMITSYGMSVGAEVFATCVWIGRFYEAIDRNVHEPILTARLPVKLHHCRDSRAKDSNIRQALVDRFAPGQPNHGKGTKAAPGWFYGFRSDVWQAYALAVYVADEDTP
jgi:hypothetical protein